MEYCLNVRNIKNRWITVYAKDYDYEFTDFEYWCDCKIVRRTKSLVKVIEADVFGEKDCYTLLPFYDRATDPEGFYATYYTAEEMAAHKTYVLRDFGFGVKPYYFDIVYLTIILSPNNCARRYYIVANEALHTDEYFTLVKYCQCDKCIHRNRVERTLSKFYKKVMNHKSESICLKNGKCDNELLKKTRRYVREYAHYNPTPFRLTPKEIKKWVKFIDN